jgi:hypothetical protein
MSFGTQGKSFRLDYSMPSIADGMTKTELRTLRAFRMMQGDPVAAKEIQRRASLGMSVSVSKSKKARVSLAKIAFMGNATDLD